MKFKICIKKINFISITKYLLFNQNIHVKKILKGKYKKTKFYLSKKFKKNNLL